VRNTIVASSGRSSYNIIRQVCSQFLRHHGGLHSKLASFGKFVYNNCVIRNCVLKYSHHLVALFTNLRHLEGL
jgi:hypothetical protein